MFNKPNYEPVTVIVDGAYMLRRAMYQPSYRELSNSRGMPTGAIYGFFSILSSLRNILGTSSLVVCFEGGHSERRMSIYEDYKKRDTKDEVEPDTGMTDFQYYSHNLSWIRTLLDKLGILNLSVPGKEGDDVIFQIAHLLRGKKIIASDDHDFFSLVTEDISIYRPIKGETVAFENFKDSTGCETPLHFLYRKVLTGDGSDNIPQVAKGVGETTITRLLETISYEELSPESIISKARAMGGTRYLKLAMAGVEPIKRNLDLIDISRETFSAIDLMNLKEGLSVKRSLDEVSAKKIMNSLEFSQKTQEPLLNMSRMISTFATDMLIDDSYILDHMQGISSSVLGGVL